MFSIICSMRAMWIFTSIFRFTNKFLKGFFIYFLFLSSFSIDDPLKKNATIGFINNFGQIPKQLFKKPHPAKKMSGNRHSTLIDPSALIQGNTTVLQSDRLFFHNLDNLKPSLQPIKELKGPVGQILQPDKTVFAVEQNKVRSLLSFIWLIF